jgi:hypothetical protein
MTIIHAIDHLYEVCKSNWNTEQKLYKEGLLKNSPSHKNTTSQWYKHESEHQTLINSILQMKQDIITHFNEKDTIFFN